MDDFIKLLNPNLECIEHKIKAEKQKCLINTRSNKKNLTCPYCGAISHQVHSVYQCEVQDLPLQGMRVILLLNTRRMFCKNPECSYTTFAEKYDFISVKGTKTTRLIEYILDTSKRLSSISATALLKKSTIKTSESSICDLLKKMLSLVDKSTIKNICIDDFVFRKRYSCGTVMVDLMIV
ncbi:transposase family protein [Clostridium sp.]|uniref:transposase family protein n=1 Tax=Clostridium sp. TaxID=1506 RepID=UPI003F33FFFC